MSAKQTMERWHIEEYAQHINVCAVGGDLVATLRVYPVSDTKMIGERADLIAAAPELLEACEAAKKFLAPNLVEPGRTVFWKLVEALTKAKGQP